MTEPGLTSRHDWTRSELRALHDLPFSELVFRAQSVHRRHHDPAAVQLCTLLSIKTGGCPEDCGYCPLSALPPLRDDGVTVCCGGRLGMGDSIADRNGILAVLAGFDPHPESVPINALGRAAGTPLSERPPLDPIELVRMIATARIVLP